MGAGKHHREVREGKGVENLGLLLRLTCASALSPLVGAPNGSQKI